MTLDNGGPPSPGYPPADFRRRAVARSLDLAIALAPLLLVPRGHLRAGQILSAALLLCGDSLFGPGRSLGKRLAGLRVLVLGRPRPCGGVWTASCRPHGFPPSGPRLPSSQ